MTDARTENTIQWIIRVLVGACVLSILAEFFIHRHEEFHFSGIPGFYAFVGFAAYCLIVLGAKALRPLLKRPEDYYGEDNSHD